jgi:hypothetical protein
MRIFVDIEEDCIGLIESSRETRGRDIEETGGLKELWETRTVED